jgi:hypothetical protein
LLLPLLLLLLPAGCNSPRPSAASLAEEPVLSPLPGEVELGEVRMEPRQGRIGVPGRDGVVERIVALELPPAAVADHVQRAHGARYGFSRVDLGRVSPVTVELRGTAPTGATVVVTASTRPPVPLYGGADDVQSVPPERPTSVVITVVSPQ